jgi:hypothetical protein
MPLTPRLLRVLTSLKIPNKITGMGDFKLALRTKYLPVLA